MMLVRGLVQTIYGKISVSMTFGGGGGGGEGVEPLTLSLAFTQQKQ